ncbi:thiamine-binding protein, partial [candidate division KSB1 bacterium]|nr:thiamine-binding protein [candidate division KSB1 bacterium]
MLASFSVIPIGVGEELKTYVADLMPIIEASGLDFKLG